MEIWNINPSELKIKIDMNEYHNYNYNFLNIFNFDVSPYYNLIQSSLLFDLIKFYKYLYLRSIKLNKLYPDIINQLKPIKEITPEILNNILLSYIDNNILIGIFILNSIELYFPY